jgi:hypothetical protein
MAYRIMETTLELAGMFGIIALFWIVWTILPA